MRLIGRILIILLVAAAVAGATALLVNNGLIGGEASEFPRGERFEAGEAPPAGAFERGERGGERGDHHAANLGRETLIELLSNLGVIGAIVLSVGLISAAVARVARSSAPAAKAGQPELSEGGG